MSVGERIKFIRKLKGMTQKQLGIAVGFNEKSADIRVAQYESGTRKPKEKILNSIAEVLEVSPAVLDVSNIDSDAGLINMFFALEDLYGFEIKKDDNGIYLSLSRRQQAKDTAISQLLSHWYDKYEKLKNGEISKKDYDQWRYNL